MTSTGFKVFIFIVGYVCFMVFILAEIEQYNISTSIETETQNRDNDIISIDPLSYLSIFWGILTFNITGGLETLPRWYNILVAVPLYAMIIYFVIQEINPLD